MLPETDAEWLVERLNNRDKEAEIRSVVSTWSLEYAIAVSDYVIRTADGKWSVRDRVPHDPIG